MIGSNQEWAQYTINKCRESDICPIFINHRSYTPANKPIISQVCVDIPGSMKSLIDALKATGHRNIVLYAVNKKSFPDKILHESYTVSVEEDCRDSVIYNNGNLGKCYQEFAEHYPNVDTVFCVNDFAAVSLVRHLRTENPIRLQSLTILSNGQLRIPEIYIGNIVLIRYPIAEYGKIAVLLYETLLKNPTLSGIMMTLKWDVSPILNKKNHLIAPAVQETATGASPEQVMDNFYNDTEVLEMTRLEMLFTNIDPLDKNILNELLKNNSYEIISIKFFLSVGSVKYRMKKMLEISGCTKKKQLVTLLRKYEISSFN